MSNAFEYGDRAQVAASSKTYGKVINEIKALWHDALQIEMHIVGETPTARFADMKAQLRGKLEDSEAKRKILEALEADFRTDAEPTVEDIIESVSDDSIVRSVDDLTANQILNAIEAIALERSAEHGSVEVNMAVFLREVMTWLFTENEINGRINIGANRHFPRLYQWLKEYSESTVWPHGVGLKIKNHSGRGRVANSPVDPKLLKVSIDYNYL